MSAGAGTSVASVSVETSCVGSGSLGIASDWIWDEEQPGRSKMISSDLPLPVPVKESRRRYDFWMWVSWGNIIGLLNTWFWMRGS